MFRDLYLLIKSWVKGTCPGCGKFTSEGTCPDLTYEEILWLRSVGVCFDEYHTRKVKEFNEKLQRVYEK